MGLLFFDAELESMCGENIGNRRASQCLSASLVQRLFGYDIMFSTTEWIAITKLNHLLRSAYSSPSEVKVLKLDILHNKVGLLLWDLWFIRWWKQSTQTVWSVKRLDSNNIGVRPRTDRFNKGIRYRSSQIPLRLRNTLIIQLDHQNPEPFGIIEDEHLLECVFDDTSGQPLNPGLTLQVRTWMKASQQVVLF